MIEELKELLEEYISKANENILIIDSSKKVLFVGDLHGDLDTINKVKNVFDEYEKVVFLGDYVDRGRKDIEVLIEVLKLKLEHWDKIVLLRGNHEDLQMNLFYGFAMRLKYHGFSDWEILQKFYDKLNYVYLNKRLRVMGLHGGPPDFYRKVEEITDLNEKEKELILWSDFNWDNPDIDFLPSPRGAGILYGKNPLKTFMEINDLKYLVRGHEYFSEGYRIFKIDNKFLITIFSSSANAYYFVKKKILEMDEKGFRIIDV